MSSVMVSLMLLVPSITAQSSGPTAQIEAMKKLSFLVGEWKGSGWMAFGDRRSEFNATETATVRAGGVVLMVEGHHTVDLPGQAAQRVVHEAFGVLWYDESSGSYNFQAFLATGRHSTFKARCDGKQVVWGYEDPHMGKVRYTITIDEKGRWFEIGERDEDEKGWTKFFEMTLSRVE